MAVIPVHGEVSFLCHQLCPHPLHPRLAERCERKEEEETTAGKTQKGCTRQLLRREHHRQAQPSSSATVPSVPSAVPYCTVPYTTFSGTPPCTHPRRAVQALDPKSRQTDPANFNTALSLIRHDERELFALYCCMSARTFGAGVARSWLAPPSASSLSQQKAMDSALIPCGRQRHQKSGGTIKQADPCCGSNRLTLNLGSVS